MRMQRSVFTAITGQTLSDEAIQQLDYEDQDQICGYRVIARGHSDVLFDAYDSYAFTWLGLSINVESSCLEFNYGTALKGAGYRGIPLQDFLLSQLAMPFHAIYARLLLKASIGLMLEDLKKRT